MRAKTLKSKYPEIWTRTYDNMINDLLICMPGCDIKVYEGEGETSRISRIAHNAAFFACDAVHHEIKRNHIKLIK